MDTYWALFKRAKTIFAQPIYFKNEFDLNIVAKMYSNNIKNLDIIKWSHQNIVKIQIQLLNFNLKMFNNTNFQHRKSTKFCNVFGKNKCSKKFLVLNFVLMYLSNFFFLDSILVLKTFSSDLKNFTQQT